MTTPDTPTVETRKVPVHGREITIRRLGDTQIALLMREVKILDRLNKRADSGEPFDIEQRDRMISAISRIYDLMESVVTDEDDVAHLLDLVTKNELPMSEFIGFMRAFADAPVASAPTVRRGPGRPRKNAAR